MLIRTEFTPLAAKLAGTNGLNHAGFRAMRPVAEGNSFAAVLASQNNKNKTQSSPPDGIPSIILGPGIYHAYSEELARGPDLSRHYSEVQRIQARLSWDQNLKYFDFSSGISLEQVIEAGKNADYSGMSDADKYMAIYNRYTEAFGEDFWMGELIYIPERDSIFSRVPQELRKELLAVFGSSDNITQARRTALYGDMSDSEIQSEVSLKYPSANQMTLRELTYMTWEMSQVGVDGGLSKVVDNMVAHITLSDLQWLVAYESLLDQRINYDLLCRGYNGSYMAGSVSIHTGFLLQEMFGVTLNGKGYAYPPPGLDYLNWDELIKQWTTNYLRWTDEEHEEFFLLRQIALNRTDLSGV